uniref:Uncharacterized protein n=1 Tax=Mycena chlorophos TaxID=658473 RepID=A0ABQ0LKK2_MYCCL|nr:predicted protein [Mycena chlorophos]
MDDDVDSLRTVLPPVVVATALATLFIAGSASVIRHRRSHLSAAPVIPEVKVEPVLAEPKPTARSKERRKRGKDPLKDALKGNGGKKQQQQLNKLLATGPVESASSSHSALIDVDEDGDVTPSSGIVRPVTPSPHPPNPDLAAPPVRTRQPTAPDPWDWDGQAAPVPATASSDDLARNRAAASPSPSASGSAPASNASASGSSSAGLGTPPPQTQLASLRGALEAARLREEKARAELERATRDADALRWENGAWRRREAELQSQVHHLMHQVQAYASLYMQHPQHLQVPGSGGTSPNSPASPGFGPSPFVPPSPSGYVHPPPMFFPPMAFYGYPPGGPSPPQPQHPPHPQQASLFSMLFPNKSGSRGSGSSTSASASASVSSSSGADSPDLPPLGQLMMDRGRQRTRVHTADGRLDGHRGESRPGWEEEGWIGGGEADEYPEYDDNDTGSEEKADDEDEGGEFNEMLADAILKRPESIRVGSKKRKDPDYDVSPAVVEFTFPSLIDSGLGGVHSVQPVVDLHVVVPDADGDAELEMPSDSSDAPETDSGEVTPAPHATAPHQVGEEQAEHQSAEER